MRCQIISHPSLVPPNMALHRFGVRAWEQLLFESIGYS